MKKILRLGFILLVISFIAAGALAFTNDITAPAIAEQREAASALSRKEVAPTAETFEPIAAEELTAIQAENPDVVEAFTAMAGSEAVGYVVKSTPRGFGGPVEVVVGIGMDGNITGVRMGNHTETPGLGDSAKKPNFYEQFNGMKTDREIGVNKTTATEYEIQAISGATITSKCITQGVNNAIAVVTKLIGK